MNIRQCMLTCALATLGGCASMASSSVAPAAPVAASAQAASAASAPAPAHVMTAPKPQPERPPSADMTANISSTPRQALPARNATIAEPHTAPAVIAAPHHAAPRRTHRSVAATPANATPAAPARELRGRIELRAANGEKLAASDYAHTLVYFVPASGAARPRPGHFTVYTHNRDFDPDWLAIPQGSSVTFTNLDEVTHNVFSVTPGSAFDAGYASAGQSTMQRFDHAGMVLISCHVHRYMKGNILVVPSRFATTVASDGRFRLDHLPAGSGTLYFWNPRSTPAVQKVQPPFGLVRQRLVIGQPPVKTRIEIGSTP